ncbi:D-galactarate dehydratase [Anatilimnocola aggregata]|uniref:D-galactarate dehydratase n=1 Tax=Anatilimnocola aggregata TaxID=2528021 RepID=A0A517YN11_9BACT|nr:altronate dehydratase family protein [Anatilimnocola aggregata]QDU31602.1 D-galactarate dehydratase [Anatilimnocola aggregata]
MIVTAGRRADVVHLHPEDNIVVAARHLDAGEQLQVAGRTITLAQSIKIGHKIALVPIAEGALVLKYGQIIGSTTSAAEPGDWIHSHNLHNGDFVRDYAKAQEIPADLPPITGRTFQGYRRKDGRAGTRNYIGIISSVNCSSTVSRYIAEKFDKQVLKDYPNIDGVIAFRHGGGCGLQYGGLQHEILARTLAGAARHPNIGGFLIIGLGCENAPIGYLLDSQKLISLDGKGNRKLPPILSMQDLGGTAKTVEAGIKALAELLPQGNDVRREPIPISEIILGTNCGGSDGNSGVTCNPALGVASDMLVAAGGTSVLAETTEIYGAEHLLTRRAKSVEVADKLLERIKWWLWHTSLYGVEIDNNPSVGNKEGGLTTIAEKSLGAVAKAGTTALSEVYQYAEPITAKGFCVMDTPGFDPPSVTGLVAGGCNMIVFTTGRGSCFGCKPVPSIKVASNTPMYERMIDDMDINAGEILNGKSVDEVGREIFEKIISVASGEKTKSELLGYGDEEFVPWQIGPTL